jgi:hypothetical protein
LSQGGKLSHSFYISAFTDISSLNLNTQRGRASDQRDAWGSSTALGVAPAGLGGLAKNP